MEQFIENTKLIDSINPKLLNIYKIKLLILPDQLEHGCNLGLSRFLLQWALHQQFRICLNLLYDWKYVKYKFILA